MSCNADAQRFAVSRGDRTQIRVDDDRRCSVEVTGGTVKHALGSTTTTRATKGAIISLNPTSTGVVSQ
jgi:hypothetical protein